MMRNLKALGLALVAVVALSAVAASAASAAFVTGSESTTLTASAITTQAFVNSEGLAVECTGVSGSTTVGETQESISAVPSYSGCSIAVPGFGSFNAKVSNGGCEYLFTSSGTVHVVCPSGGHLEVKGEFVPPFFSKCLDIGAQTPTTSTVHYANVGSGTTKDVEIESTVAGVTYTETGICGEATKNDANYTGKVTITGEDAEGHHIPVEHT